MKTNVKAGDLAIIVGAQMCPENNGRIVEVVRPFLPGEVWGNSVLPTNRPSWIVRSVGSPLACAFTNALTGQTRTEYRPERPYGDRLLRPIHNPGDDAVDEMVQIVGKPEGVKA